MILSASHLNKSFGGDVIIKDASLLVNARERVAVVGNNGAGKTTLLDMLTGESRPDSGTVSMTAGTTVGYLKQINDIDSEDTLVGELTKVIQPILDVEVQMQNVQDEMKNADGAELEKLYERYGKLMHEYEMADGYSAKSRVTGILKGLGFTEAEFSKKVHMLSGGEKTRLFLGRILLSNPDIIFLDEPTNHLDLSSIEWLENYLINYPGTVVLVSHDRYFLDRIVGKIVDIEAGKVQTYTGNYTAFAAKKAMLYEAGLKAYMKQQAEIKHQEQVIEKLRSFNREKSIKRAESRKKVLDKIERIEKPSELKSEMNLSFEQDYASGKDVLEVDGISKHFPDKTLFEDISFQIKRGEHVSIIGDNGTGKTTILKMLTGLEDPDRGIISFGAGVVIAYYDQEHQVLDSDKTIFDEIQDDYPNMDNTSVRNTLGAFLFTEDDVFKRIGDLSGGERGRVSLVKLMLSKANFLILDEPTNHLDMISKEILEEAVRNFEGTVLYVSHDRYFINRTATRILNLSNGRLLDYIGNYDYYLEKRDAMEAYKGAGAQANTASQTGKTGSGSGAEDFRLAKQKAAVKKKRMNRIAKTEEEIKKLESQLQDIEEQFGNPAIQTDSTRLGELQKEKDKAEEKLEELLAEWEELLLEDEADE